MAAKEKEVTAVLTPTDDKKRKEVVVKVDIYYVVVGFEVNKPEAFKANQIDLPLVEPITVTYTHDLAVDYGHAFFYIVKNDKISQIFSFGPEANGKRGWFGKGSDTDTSRNKHDGGAILKDGRANTRGGTPDYRITEIVNAFKIPLAAPIGIALETKTNVMRKKIVDLDQQYTAYMNDTCAETARDLLSSAGIDTPSGSSMVKKSNIVNFPVAYAINPYMWHHNFVTSKKYAKTTGELEDGEEPSRYLGRRDPFSW